MVLFDTGKGMGLAGMTIVIVRDDLVKQQLPICPDLMSFEFSLRTKSIINTPFTLVPLLLAQTLTKQL
jgi:phosphoserine aminotransferase